MTEIIDQPAPVPNDRPAIADLVIADMAERKRIGIERYGMPLQAGNGRDALVDAYQEALDLCMYLRQAIEERGQETPATLNRDNPAIAPQVIPAAFEAALLRQAIREDGSVLDFADDFLRAAYPTRAWLVRAAWGAAFATALGYGVTVAEGGCGLAVGDRQPAERQPAEGGSRYLSRAWELP